MTRSGMRYQGAPDRRAHILARLREVGFISCTELARELGVSQMTIRRDLQLLESGGHVCTVHGGARLAPGFRATLLADDADGESTRRIAQCAAQFVRDDDTIAVDAGIAAYHLVQALSASFRGTVITHSMPVMQVLADRPSPPRLVALGGELIPARRAFAGPATVDAIGSLRTRTFFLSAAAVDARGLYARSVSEAGVERRLIDIADRVVLLAPTGVFTGSAPALIGPLNRLTAVISDRPPPRSVMAAFRRADTALHIASAARDGGRRPTDGEVLKNDIATPRPATHPHRLPPVRGSVDTARSPGHAEA